MTIKSSVPLNDRIYSRCLCGLLNGNIGMSYWGQCSVSRIDRISLRRDEECHGGANGFLQPSGGLRPTARCLVSGWDIGVHQIMSSFER